MGTLSYSKSWGCPSSRTVLGATRTGKQLLIFCFAGQVVQVDYRVGCVVGDVSVKIHQLRSLRSKQGQVFGIGDVGRCTSEESCSASGTLWSMNRKVHRRVALNNAPSHMSGHQRCPTTVDRDLRSF